MVEKRKLQVEAINTGTVIDHIPAGQGAKILRQLQLLGTDLRITVGFNLPSQELGLKDIIKLENRLLDEAEASALGLFAPKATINIIENYVIRNKFHMSVPEKLEGVFECPNSNCITHNEPVQSVLNVQERNGDIRLKCGYCEKSFSKDIVAGL